MADYIYTMAIRLTPDQQRGVAVVQEVARVPGMNVYLTGGAMRDIISGFPIRDLDFTVQGNPLKLQKDLERAGATVQGTDDDLKTLYLLLPGNVRAEISMARSERYEKSGKPPVITPATIAEDLRRVLHNYAFVEDPSRLSLASRFAARFHWPIEERTQARYESGKENNYIE